MTEIGFGNNVIFGSCKSAVFAGLNQLTTLNLTGFPVLEILNCKRMTSLLSATLPFGSSLETIYLPANITSLTLDNKTKLETLEIEESANEIEGEYLTNISVTECNSYAALKALDLLANYLS